MSHLVIKRITIVTILFLGLTTLLSCSRGVSIQERELAQGRINYGEELTLDELQSIKKPSKFFPYLEGLFYLRTEEYANAKTAFEKLTKSFKKSKVAEYYFKLASYGTEQPGPIVEVVHNFHRELFKEKNEEFSIYKSNNKEMADQFIDKMIAAYFPKGDHKNIDVDIPEKTKEIVTSWFKNKYEKKPVDYTIYTITQKESKDKLAIIEEGLEKYPNDPDLMAWKFSILTWSKEPEDLKKRDALMKELRNEPYYELIDIAQAARSVLQPEIIERLKKIKWSRYKTMPEKDYIQMTLDRYNDEIGSDIDSQTRIMMMSWQPLAPGLMKLLDLSKAITTTSSLARKEKDFQKARDYLKWNYGIYSSILKRRPLTLLARMILQIIAEDTLYGEILILKDEFPDQPEKWKEKQRFLDKVKILTFYLKEFVKDTPFIHTVGVPLTYPYEIYEAQYPKWVDVEFLRNQ